MEPEKRFVFGPFRLDVADECLWRDKEGIRLTPKAFAVLKFLVEHSGRLVTKESLLEKLWPGVYVTEGALTVCLTEIRKALGDDSKEPKFIETVHRRGYRFIAPVTNAEQLASEKTLEQPTDTSLLRDSEGSITPTESYRATGRERPYNQEKQLWSSMTMWRGMLRGKGLLAKPWRGMAVAIAALLMIGVAVLTVSNYASFPRLDESVTSRRGTAFTDPAKPSIAVLAFDNMTGDPSQEYLSDGIADDIITRLARLPDLDVIARNSSFAYKQKEGDMRQVGEVLGVRYLLEGSAQKAGDRIRINAQLIDASTGKHLWAESYDRELNDMFAVQDDITLKVVKSLLAKLSRGETFLLTKQGTQNLKAWEAAMQASWHANKVTRDDNARARKLFQKALEYDPDFALMYAKLGRTHFVDWRRKWSKDSAASFAAATDLANKALAIDEANPSAHALLARIYLAKKDYEKALVAAERSVALAPNDPGILANCALRLMVVGRYDEGLRMMEKAVRLDPYDASLRQRLLSRAYYLVGRYEEAIDAARKYIALNVKRGQISNRTVLVASLVAAGRQPEARAEADQLVSLFPDYSAKATVTGRGFFGRFKDQKVKEQLFAQLLKAGLPE